MDSIQLFIIHVLAEHPQGQLDTAEENNEAHKYRQQMKAHRKSGKKKLYLHKIT